jgi:dihydrofolate reductase
VGKLMLSEFVTLDGVMEDPGGDEGFPLGGWQVPFFDEALNDAAQAVLAEADALLLGRVTFERFSRVWPSITDEQGFAEKMNAMPKFVASNTLTEPIGWHGKVIKGDVASEIARLKQDHDLLVNGSGELVQTLLKSRLIDDVRLWLHPVVLGAGKQLFRPGVDKTIMRLRDTRRTPLGVMILALDVPR